MIALDFNDSFFQRPAGAATFLQRGGQGRERIKGQRHAGDGGHRLAATALAFAAYARNAVAGRDHGLFADTGVHRLTAIRAMTTCVGGKYQATKGGEGCGFFGHRQSSWEDKDWSRHLGRRHRPRSPTQAGAALLKRTLYKQERRFSLKRSRSVTAKSRLAKSQSAPIYAFFATPVC